jgi:hypothetical protein
MSARRDDDDEDDRAAPPDHRGPLSQRDAFDMFLHDRAVRPFLFGVLGGLAMMFLVLFLGGSDIGAVAVALFGLATVALRWTAAPPLLILFLFWFSLFPLGLPDPDGLFGNPFEVRETHFRVTDVVLVLAALVYLRCQYRLFGLVQQAMPFENVFRRKGDAPLRRPTSHVEPTEIAWLLAAAFALVVVGQFLWWLVNALEFVPTDDEFPVRWADPTSLARYRRGAREPGEHTAGASRFFVMTGALFFGFLLVRLVFGYWRLRAMTPAAGATVLTDTSWAESHRERVRVEKWRIWARLRAADQRRRAALAERDRKRKEAEEQMRAEDAARKREEAAARKRRADTADEDDDRPRRRAR